MSFLIDTHAHMADEKIKPNIEQVLKECLEKNVQKIISIGCSINEARGSIELAEKYAGIIYATAGLYPHDNEIGEEIHLNIDERLSIIRELAANERVKAIGECGLDFTTPPPHEKKRSTHEQEYLFMEQIKLASQIKKPVIIHSREASEETLRIIREAKKTYDFSCVWHCFTENYEIAAKALDLDMMLSFTGIITYLKAEDIRQTLNKIPLEKIMIETDCPYLVPQVARKAGIKINNPSYVKIVAQEIASIKKVEFEKIVEITNKNASRFFGI